MRLEGIFWKPRGQKKPSWELVRKHEFAELKTANSCLRAWKGFSGSYADRKNLPGELVRKQEFAELKIGGKIYAIW